MNESKHQTNSLYETVPTIAEINRVPGFDPLKFLRLTVSETGAKVWKLELGYMRAWFRIARPNGRLKFKPLRITEQMAIFEAQVFLDRNDAEPFTNFTAQCSLDEADNGNYIKAAQDAALVVALSDAGFGIQFVDLTHKQVEERYGSEVPVRNPQEMHAIEEKHYVTESAAAVSPVATDRTQKQAVEADLAVKVTDFPKKDTMSEQLPVQPGSNNSVTEGTATQLPVPSAGENLPIQEKTRKEVIQESAEQLPAKVIEDSLPVQSMAEQLPVSNITEGLPVQAAVETVNESLPVTPHQVSYTQDTPLEQILKQMTQEEAQNVVVDLGVCNGWTMAEVAERRAPSLKYYVYGGYRGNNNILKAAAQIMLESLTEQKAS